MKVSFYTLSLYPFFISVSLFAQEAVRPRAQKKAQEPSLSAFDGLPTPSYPLLLDLVDNDAQPTVVQQSKDNGQKKKPKVYKNGFTRITDEEEAFDPRGLDQKPIPPEVVPPAANPQLTHPVAHTAQPFDVNFAIQNTAQSVAQTVSEKIVAAQEAKPIEHSQHVTNSNTKKCKSISPKEEAAAALRVLMQCLYLRIDSEKCRTDIKKAIVAKAKLLKKQFPEDPGIDKWFVNQPIDNNGNTVAHHAALNMDVALLKEFHKMGVDIFKQNNEGITPEDMATRNLVSRANFSETQKICFDDNSISDDSEDTREHGNVKHRKKKSSSSSASTTTPVIRLSIAERKEEVEYHRECMKLLEKQNKDRFKRYQKLQEFYAALATKK